MAITIPLFCWMGKRIATSYDTQPHISNNNRFMIIVIFSSYLRVNSIIIWKIHSLQTVMCHRNISVDKMIRNPKRISSFYYPSLFTSIHLLKKGSSSSYPSLRITYPCCPSRFKLLKAVLGESIPTPCRKGRLDGVPICIVKPIKTFLSVLLKVLHKRS